MKRLFTYTIPLLLLSLLHISCTKEEINDDYEGLNQVYLSILGETTHLDEAKERALTVEVLLTKPRAQVQFLNFVLMNDEQEVIKLEDNPVNIPAGETKGRFTVHSNRKNILTRDTLLRIGLSEVPEGMKLARELLVRVKPNPANIPLTDQQKALIESYKKKFGIDLMPWIGAVSCHTKVMSPAGGYTIPFSKAFTKEYKGESVITLSEKATGDVPVLKMVDDPLGLTSYMEWVLQQETVFNDEFWFNPNSGPNYKIITGLLGWNKENPGIFSMTLDDIVLKDISKDAATLECKGTKITGGGDITPTIPFRYTFSPWEKQKRLIAEGNQQAKDLEDADGTANPDHYLMIWSVDKDEINDGAETGHFILPRGKIDFKERKLTFQFAMSHSMAGDYTRVYVTYEKNN
ncbi:DUF4929 family protein [Porphyromonas sp.]|uniref:DUF4929 family protein n=1 Tax=Porphyromonas sp. TaxID=1924944 RepID=UPI0026DB5327|nr:DUF4929 family protein [Porphyromonas sp.]MDO4770794.1 DUF4929 family protein [Porphyromonas sp.]